MRCLRSESQEPDLPRFIVLRLSEYDRCAVFLASKTTGISRQLSQAAGICWRSGANVESWRLSPCPPAPGSSPDPRTQQARGSACYLAVVLPDADGMDILCLSSSRKKCSTQSHINYLTGSVLCCLLLFFHCIPVGLHLKTEKNSWYLKTF